MSRTVIVAAVASLVLAACTGTTEPAQPPTSEDALTTTSPVTEEVAVTTEAAPTTEEPEETEADGPPDMPEEAKEQTEAGAEAFVEHYVQSLDHAYATGESDHLSTLTRTTCASCSALLEDLPDNPEAEQTFATRSISAELIGQDLARVEAELTVLRGSGAGDGVLVFDLERDTAGWLVSEIRVQEEP